MNRAVFMDRDDTVIHDPGYLSDPAGVKLLPGADIAIKSLNAAGYKIIIVTNQSGIARGKLTLETLQEIHDELRDQLARKLARIDAIYSCPFHPEGTIKEFAIDSDLRKPRPGMLLKAAQDLNIDLSASWMVGDGMRDVEAGKRAGCRTILIGLTPSAHDLANGGETSPDIVPDFRVRNLVEAARVILREEPRATETPAATAASQSPVPEVPITPASPVAVKAETPAEVVPSTPALIETVRTRPEMAAEPWLEPEFERAEAPPETPAPAPIATPQAPLAGPVIQAEPPVEEKPVEPFEETPAVAPPAELPFESPVAIENTSESAPLAAEPLAAETVSAEAEPSPRAWEPSPAPVQEDFEEPMERQAAPQNREEESLADRESVKSKSPSENSVAHYDEFPDVTERDVQMEILRELRKLSGTDKDESFSFTRMIATVSQGLAILTLLTAIANRIYSYTPAATLATDTVAWVMVALVLQVMAATFWIMKRG